MAARAEREVAEAAAEQRDRAAGAVEQCPCGQGATARCTCASVRARTTTRSGASCAALPAVPASAALLEPVRDGSGTVTDFLIRAGNHVRSAQWLAPPDQQVGRRYLAACRAAASGLRDALVEVLETGRALGGLVVDYTEERFGRLRRVQLVHHAARCGDRLLMTWRPVRSRAELLTIDAQHLASMGWGRWDLLSGTVSWSEGMQRIFARRPAASVVPAGDV